VAPRTPAEVAALIEPSWVPFRAALAALPPGGFDRATLAGWTVREMLGHVAFWMETIEPVIVGMFRGQPIQDDDWYGGDDLAVGGEWPRTDVHNAREAAWARSRQPADVLARLDAAHRRALEVVGTLTESELREARYLRKVLDGSADHFALHLAEVHEAAAGSTQRTGQ
jgi:hypothetical protein